MDASIRISFGCNIYHNHTFESSYGENSLSAIKNKKASLNVIMIASIGMMTILVNLIALFFGNETKVTQQRFMPDGIRFAHMEPILYLDFPTEDM